MSNIKAEIRETKDGKSYLSIIADVGDTAVKQAGLSKSGKNKIVASTNGFLTVANGSRVFKVSVNVITDKGGNE